MIELCFTPLYFIGTGIFLIARNSSNTALQYTTYTIMWAYVHYIELLKIIDNRFKSSFQTKGLKQWPLVNCFLCMYEKLNLDTQHPHKRQVDLFQGSEKQGSEIPRTNWPAKLAKSVKFQLQQENLC